MKLWLRKIVVAFVAVMTLGLYIPPIALTLDADESKDAISEKSNIDEQQSAVAVVEHEIRDERRSQPTLEDRPTARETYLEHLTEGAKEQAFMKFGPRMIDRVEDEFTTDILPVIEDVIEAVIDRADEDELAYYAITEEPAHGFGERIFNVYDVRNQSDLVRFHVRRENRPLEGYWFNFHYHLSDDQFETHHDIGEIYWDKNIPPKWMS
ncbi:MAG TPA: YpjP family protein [Cerasibacillus sp.]|uniref:YpjP family protein n=1 Tax=Cerasibacillus sp. TaxID=2498711 RepID=UPI002F3F2DE3